MRIRTCRWATFLCRITLRSRLRGFQPHSGHWRGGEACGQRKGWTDDHVVTIYSIQLVSWWSYHHHILHNSLVFPMQHSAMTKEHPPEPDQRWVSLSLNNKKKAPSKAPSVLDVPSSSSWWRWFQASLAKVMSTRQQVASRHLPHTFPILYKGLLKQPSAGMFVQTCVFTVSTHIREQTH